MSLYFTEDTIESACTKHKNHAELKQQKITSKYYVDEQTILITH